MGILQPFLSQAVKNTPGTFPGRTVGAEQTCVSAFLYFSSWEKTPDTAPYLD